MIAALAALAGLVCVALAWVLDPGHFAFAWLAAFWLWLGWPLGSLAWLLIHALTGGKWGIAARPALLAGVASLPLLLLALVPLGLGFHALYDWTHTAHQAGAFYLTVPFAVGRAALYLVVWMLLAVAALRRGISAALAAGGLILLALTVSFAAIDATLALAPEFGSSIWGMVSAASMGLLSMAMAALVSAPAAPPAVRADLAKLMLGMVVLWAYLEFSQLVIVWESDLPKESAWYLARIEGGWYWLTWAVALLNFGVPFALLIFAPVRRSALGVCGVAAMLVLASVLRAFWVVLPAAHRLPLLTDGACVLGLVLLSVAAARVGPAWRGAHA